MPRRRNAYTREIPVLLRDAQPTRREIKDEPNLRKRREILQARDSAIDVLTRMYRDAEKRGALAQLDIRVRNFCEGVKTRNRRLHRRRQPKPKGGRPTGERRRRLSLAIKVHETIEAGGEKRGRIESALNEVSDSSGVSCDYLREIHYDRDREWSLAVKAELAFKYEMAAKPPALWFWEVQLRSDDWIALEVFVGQGKKAWWRPSVEQVPTIWARGV